MTAQAGRRALTLHVHQRTKRSHAVNGPGRFSDVRQTDSKTYLHPVTSVRTEYPEMVCRFLYGFNYSQSPNEN